MRHHYGLAMLLAGILLGPSAALASSKCVCDNGKIMTTASNAEDACETACDLFGGGRAWSDDDEAAAKVRAGVPSNQPPADGGPATTPSSRAKSASADEMP